MFFSTLYFHSFCSVCVVCTLFYFCLFGFSFQFSSLHPSYLVLSVLVLFFFFKQKTAYELRISDWSSDVCSSDLPFRVRGLARVCTCRHASSPPSRACCARRRATLPPLPDQPLTARMRLAVPRPRRPCSSTPGRSGTSGSAIRPTPTAHRIPVRSCGRGCRTSRDRKSTRLNSSH